MSAPQRTSGRRHRSAEERWVVWLLAAIGGLGVLLAPAAPTGVDWWDAVLRFAFGAGVVLAASTAQRWASILLAMAAAALSGLTVWLAFGAAALLLAVGSVQLSRRDRLMGAGVGALAVQAIVRWPSLGPFGVPSLIAAIVTAVVVLSAYRLGRRKSRRAMRIGGVAVGLGVVVVVGVFLVAAVGARTDAERGVAAARNGLEAIRQGESSRALDQLGQAERSLDAAHRSLGSRWLWPARLVPVLSQHAGALDDATEIGNEIASEARLTLEQADIDSISLSRGRVDIDRLAAMTPQLDRTVETLVSSASELEQLDRDWLVPPLVQRLDELGGEVDRVLPEARLSAAAAQVLPTLLGADRPMRYFVIFGSPAESREFGGFIGSWALLDVADGRMTKVESGRPISLYERARAGSLDDPAGYPPIYLESARPNEWPQNLTSSASLLEIRRAVIDLFPELGGAPIDAVIYLDPYALAALLELTGPITIGDPAIELSSENLTAFLFQDQYETFDSSADRFGFLTEVLDATFDALLQTELPGPDRLGQILGPVARQGRMQIATGDPLTDEFLRSVFLLRTFHPTTSTDFLSVRQSNGGVNKLDAFLTRSISYDVRVDDATGALAATVRVDLTLDVPPDAPRYMFGSPEVAGLAPDETEVLLSLYTPHQLRSLTVDGEPGIASFHQELGLNRYLEAVRVGVGETVRLSFDVEGQVRPEESYSLLVDNQPLVNDDLLSVSFGPPGSAPTPVLLTVTEDTLFVP